MNRFPVRRGALVCLALMLGAAGGFGCARPKPVQTVTVANRALGHATVAVAPAINLSGSLDFDPNRFADLMAIELGYADGLSVIPVSRVLGVLAVEGKDRVESPTHAAELIEWLGADAMLVFAVTAYEPHEPPRVGISAQVFARDTEPKPDSKSADESGLASPVGPDQTASRSIRIIAEHQQVYDASHESVLRSIQAFAQNRTADDSPYGWRRYVVSQEGFIQFCCHEAVTALLAQRPAKAGAVHGQGG